jgi:microcystin-dependent protein
MTIDRTQLILREANEFATLDDINNVYNAVNNLKNDSADASTVDLEVAIRSSEANDRGIKFWLTASTWIRMFWDQTNSVFRFVNNLGTAQKVAFAAGTDSTHGVNKGQMDSAIGALQLEVVGAIKIYAGSSAPTGYLLCDGTAVSRTTYAALFAICSTTYGAGNGTTTFNLPDLRGRVPLGLDNMGGVTAGRITSASLNGGNATTRGGTGGEETHANTGGENGPHSHAPANGNAFAVLGFGSGQFNGGGTNQYTATGNTTTASSGSGTPHNNMQPWLALNYIIKT